MKQLVHNRAKPEGSIAENYSSNETLMFISRYLRDVETKLNRQPRVMDGIFYNDRGEDTRFNMIDLAQAHAYVLNNLLIFDIYCR